MKILGLVWVGTRTTSFDETTAFFRDVLGLAVHSSEPDFEILDVPGGATVEIFGPSSEWNRHLEHPVAGFLVDDLVLAAAELHEAGAEIVLPMQDGGDRAWMHFRAPDGFVYELVEERSSAEPAA